MRPAIRPFCTRHWVACDWECAFVWLRVCAFVPAHTRFVCVSPLICLKACTVCKGGKESRGTTLDMYSLAHYHVNALCFLSTCLCQTRGPQFSLPGLKRRSGQAPTWCGCALALSTRSLAPQTLLLASSRFSPSVLASQPPRNESVGMRWEDSIQKHLMTDGGLVTDQIQIIMIWNYRNSRAGFLRCLPGLVWLQLTRSRFDFRLGSSWFNIASIRAISILKPVLLERDCEWTTAVSCTRGPLTCILLNINVSMKNWTQWFQRYMVKICRGQKHVCG